MLVDDYIIHLLESHLEKQEERVYAERLDRLKKGQRVDEYVTRCN